MSAFAPLFVPEELREAVSGRAWLEGMLEAERALAAAGARAGVVPAEAAEAIASACRTAEIDWEELLRDGRRVGTPVEPLVRRLAATLPTEAAPWLHRGATSQDVLDTAAMLVARRALGVVLLEAERVAGACAGLAQEHRSTPMAARTLLQQALPTTFGLKAAGWLVAVLDARARLSTVRRDGLAAQLGGAAGTLASLGDEGLATARYFAEEVGLPEPVLPWHTSRGRVAELGAALAVLAGVSGKIALDVCLLAQTEVGEVREAEGRGGSSTLPHKRNPVGAVLARSCAELARMHASVLGDALSSEHERAAGGWQAEWDALSGALAYAGAAAASVAEALEGLEVDAERMRRNLDATGGLVVSEALAVVLAERLGRVEAHDLVREAAARAAASGRPFRDEVLEDRRAALSPEEVDAALDPAAYLGSAEALVARALERWTAERGGA